MAALLFDPLIGGSGAHDLFLTFENPYDCGIIRIEFNPGIIRSANFLFSYLSRCRQEAFPSMELDYTED